MLGNFQDINHYFMLTFLQISVATCPVSSCMLVVVSSGDDGAFPLLDFACIFRLSTRGDASGESELGRIR